MIKQMGMRGFVDYLREETGSFTDTYAYYEKRHRAGRRELRRQAREEFADGPKFSIVVPLYHTNRDYLKQMVDSVIAQSYANW